MLYTKQWQETSANKSGTSVALQGAFFIIVIIGCYMIVYALFLNKIIMGIVPFIYSYSLG